MTRMKMNETTWPVKGHFICESRSGLAFLFRALDISGFVPAPNAFGNKRTNEIWIPFSQLIKMTRHDKITDPEGLDVAIVKEWILDKNVPGFTEWKSTAPKAEDTELPSEAEVQDTFYRFMDSQEGEF